MKLIAIIAFYIILYNYTGEYFWMIIGFNVVAMIIYGVINIIKSNQSQTKL